LRWSLLAVALFLAGCSDDAAFTLGLDHQVCEDNIPTACGAVARCVLDRQHYIDGSFPSSQQLIVRTDGEADLVFQIYLTDERAPGDDLGLSVEEPTCGESHSFDSAGRDPFRLAGSDGIVRIPLRVDQRGDHLVQLFCNAYASYTLKWGS
jgi:hypothetical protein